MATNIITASNSRSTQLVDTTPGAYLMITQAGYIVATGPSEDAYRQDGGSAVVNILGAISSADGYAMWFAASQSDSSLVGGNQITIGASGFVDGYSGTRIDGDGNTFINAGLVSAHGTSSRALYLTGVYDSVDNSGQMIADTPIYASGAHLSVRNSGTLQSSGYSAIYSAYDLNVTNTGTILGAIFASGGLTLANYGRITGTVGAQDNDGAGLYIVNSGTIEGDYSGGLSGDQIYNTGHMAGIATNQGDDYVDTQFGSVTGRVELGDGADTYIGTAGVDRVDGGLDADDIDLGAGNDVYSATNGDGKDIVDAGDGVDRYDASGTTQAVTIDLGSGITTGTVNADSIANFENATGGAAGDTLTGDDGANRLDGFMGADKIDGSAGADRLIGGTGTDTITGGVGRDIMTGGLVTGSLDSDTFVFRASDSGTTAATRDRITDFTDHGSNTAPFTTGADTIDLSAIDANTGVTGDQSFSFNATKGAAFSGTAGSLIWQQYAGYALVSGDTNGDKIADFTIQLNGTHTLFASDFVL